MDAISADLEALDSEGEHVKLVHLAETHPVVLVFLRHFG